jgi:hypothetical protein
MDITFSNMNTIGKKSVFVKKRESTKEESKVNHPPPKNLKDS